MGLLQDMAPWFTDERAGRFRRRCAHLSAGARTIPRSASWCKSAIASAITWRWSTTAASSKEPPKTTDELVALAEANTIDEDGDGRKDRYGLVWNFAEPFFAIPFLTGYGAWVFAEPPTAAEARPVPALDTPQSVDAYRFMQSLRDEYRVVPGNCDYELADSLFKIGPGGDDHQRRLELGRLSRESGHRRRRRRAADRQRDRPADAADDRAEGLLAQRERVAAKRPTRRWRSSAT